MRPASHREILTNTFPLHLLPLAPALRCYDTRRRSALVVAHPAPLAPSYLARVLLPLSYQSPNQSPPSLSLPTKTPLAPHILSVTRTSSTGTTRAPRTPPPSRLSSGSTAARDAAPWAACSLSSVRILDTRMCTHSAPEGGSPSGSPSGRRGGAAPAHRRSRSRTALSPRLDSGVIVAGREQQNRKCSNSRGVLVSHPSLLPKIRSLTPPNPFHPPLSPPIPLNPQTNRALRPRRLFERHP